MLALEAHLFLLIFMFVCAIFRCCNEPPLTRYCIDCRKGQVLIEGRA